jgi:hypothetical protein
MNTRSRVLKLDKHANLDRSAMKKSTEIELVCLLQNSVISRCLENRSLLLFVSAEGKSEYANFLWNKERSFLRAMPYSLPSSKKGKKSLMQR